MICPHSLLLVNPSLSKLDLFGPMSVTDSLGVEVFHGSFSQVRQFALSRAFSHYSDHIEDKIAFQKLYFVEHMPLFILVPCGKCEHCCYNKYLSIRNRAIMEQSCLDSPIIFFTLTYNDENLPYDGVSKSDITDFTNRFHQRIKSLGYPTTRLLITSEYGDKHGRAHYHGIIFGLSPEDVTISYIKYLGRWVNFSHIAYDAINDSWRRGFVDVEVALNDNSALNYVLKYICKQHSSLVPVGKNKCFISMPRRGGSLGTLYFQSNLDYVTSCVHNNSKMIVNCHGQLYKIPVPSVFIRKVVPPLSYFLNQKYGRLLYQVSLYIDLIINNNDGLLARFKEYLYNNTPCQSLLDWLSLMPHLESKKIHDYQNWYEDLNDFLNLDFKSFITQFEILADRFYLKSIPSPYAALEDTFTKLSRISYDSSTDFVTQFQNTLLSISL